MLKHHDLKVKRAAKFRKVLRLDWLVPAIFEKTRICWALLVCYLLSLVFFFFSEWFFITFLGNSTFWKFEVRPGQPHWTPWCQQGAVAARPHTTAIRALLVPSRPLGLKIIHISKKMQVPENLNFPLIASMRWARATFEELTKCAISSTNDSSCKGMHIFWRDEIKLPLPKKPAYCKSWRGRNRLGIAVNLGCLSWCRQETAHNDDIWLEQFFLIL